MALQVVSLVNSYWAYNVIGSLNSIPKAKTFPAATLCSPLPLVLDASLFNLSYLRDRQLSVPQPSVYSDSLQKLAINYSESADFSTAVRILEMDTRNVPTFSLGLLSHSKVVASLQAYFANYGIEIARALSAASLADLLSPHQSR